MMLGISKVLLPIEFLVIINGRDRDTYTTSYEQRIITKKQQKEKCSRGSNCTQNECIATNNLPTKYCKKSI